MSEDEARSAVEECLEVLSKKIEELAGPKRALLKRLRKEQGDVVVSKSTVKSICGGERGSA